MSHTTIYFLTEADNLEEAESQAADFLENENFYSYYTVLPDKSGPLALKCEELLDYIKDWNWYEIADGFMLQAQEYKKVGDFMGYGHSLISAGQHYAECLTIDALVYNIESKDYEVPADDEGWWAIAIDFSY